MDGEPDGVAAAALAALDRLAPEGAVGLAVSGGGDSTALMHLGALWARARGRAVEVATVDHGLRAEARAEAEGVAAAAGALGLCRAILTAGPLGPGNLSAAARAARTALLAAWAAERGLAAVALGHTLDDQAETVLMRLARGSGADGLSAMGERSERAGTVWLRPLLGLRRAALREWLAARGVGWVEDPTNEDPHYDRVRVRRALALLEPLGVTAEGLGATAARLRSQREVLEGVAARLAGEARRRGAAGEVLLHREAFRAAHPETAARLLAGSLQAVTGTGYPARRAALDGLAAEIRGAARMPPRTLAGCVVATRGPAVAICREPAAAAPPCPAVPGAVWDARIGLVAAPEGLAVGATGEGGLAALREGWTPPGWAAAARAARLSAPALLDAEGRFLGLAAGPEAARRGVRLRDLVAERLDRGTRGA